MRCFLLSCLLVAPFVSNAQRATDSLRLALSRVEEPAPRTKLLIDLCDAFFLGSRYDSLGKYADELISLNPDESTTTNVLGASYKAQSLLRGDSAEYFQRATDALTESEQAHNLKAIGINCLGMGSRSLTFGNYGKTLTYLQKGDSALAVSTEKSELMLRADIIRTISATFHHMGRYTAALDGGLESLRISSQTGDAIQLLKSYLNLGGLYGELSSPENGLGTAEDRRRYYIEAKKYMKLSYEFSVPNASPLTQAATACNLGMLYREDNHYDSAHHYLDIAIGIGRKVNFHEMLANAYLAKAMIWEKHRDSADFYTEHAMVSAVRSLNPYLEISTTLHKAKSLFQGGDLVMAEKLATSALDKARTINRLNDIRAAWLLLHEIRAEKGDYKAALQFYRNYESVKDSIVSEKNFATIEELKVRYESELKDNSISNLEQQAALNSLQITQRNYVVAGLVFVGLLAGGTIYLVVRGRSLAQEQKMLSVENKFLRSQLNPHFFFNALVSIQRYLGSNDPKAASDYLGRFSKLMRQTLEHTRLESIPLERELDSIRNYLDLQKMRLKGSFDYSITVDAAIDQFVIQIPPMFIQPFVENAIEHGFRDQNTDGLIEIAIGPQGDKLAITITDNGTGFQYSTGSDHRSLSTTITQERMDVLNASSQNKVSFRYGTPPSGRGTQVIVYLPNS